jgi:hypothetical protein
MSSDGISRSKASLVITDILKFQKSVEDGTVKLSVIEHKTRSQKEIYFVHATEGGSRLKLFFALPSGVVLEKIVDETPRLALKIGTDEHGVTLDESLKAFEVAYREFIVKHIEPLLKATASYDKELKLATFSKADGATSKFIMLNLPRDMKDENITRLIEARGSRVLINISYIYLLKDDEKGRAVYGSVHEVGRFPYLEASGKPPLPKSAKRKADFKESELEKKIAKEEEAVPEVVPEASGPVVRLAINSTV